MPNQSIITEFWKEKKLPAPVSAPKEFLEFSSSKNVIHIMLGAFQSDFFEEIIATDPSYYKWYWTDLHFSEKQPEPLLQHI